MIDLLLFAGRIALIVLLYLFIAFTVKAGTGVIRSGSSKKKMGVYCLTVTNGPAAIVGTTIPINSTILIGRSEGNDVQVADDFVSSKHARVTPMGEGAIIEDLNSTNGTLLNGRQITTPHDLAPGDKIDIGTFSMTVDVR